jgi:hypothetical protein
MASSQPLALLLIATELEEVTTEETAMEDSLTADDAFWSVPPQAVINTVNSKAKPRPLIWPAESNIFLIIIGKPHKVSSIKDSKALRSQRQKNAQQ